MNLPDGLAWVQADADQLEKAVVNLLHNGAQAMHRGGILRVSLFRDQDQVVLEFRDTGHGMTPEVAENIFNPFFTTKAKGTGLGLAITHKVITEHGGRISVDSREQEGTCFTVRLPGISPARLSGHPDPASDPEP